jgi:hypothetical protein
VNKDTRNAIERATQRARKLLEEDFAAQLEGDFDVHRNGAVAATPGQHLTPRQAFQRERVVAAIEHKRATPMTAAGAARDYLRDAAFTTLNRFVALKMLEARELVQECITKGEQSAGYREFCGMAPGLPLLPDSAGYRLYIESLFDELSSEVKALFDRRDPSSVLWPKRATFDQLLEILNAGELAGVWGEDETIGWVYQFFNGQDERRKMREESAAPRNSRELAARNQFFTPRYVIQFLAENTLGRIWYEMRGTKTVLAERCEYMVRMPGEKFVPRAKKDPRDLRVLDPACGSGHFLLYAFDLLLTIYEEAYGDPESPTSETTGRRLAEDYATLEELRRSVPGLILAHNLYGVDIDARCAQIAQLALWMRAQKACRDFGIARAQRSQIRRSNVVVAEPLVVDDQIAKQFIAELGDAELGRMFTALVDALKLAGDLGLLLRVETLVARPAKRGETGDLFAPPEERIRAALDRYVAEEGSRTSTRRRLFADDTAQAVGLLATAEKRFDVVLMNPPFGAPTDRGKPALDKAFPLSKPDILCAFVERAKELAAATGYVGAITNRSVLFGGSMRDWRSARLLGEAPVRLLADLGHGVLDGALVEAAAYVLGPTGPDAAIGLLDATDKGDALRRACADSSKPSWRPLRHSVYRALSRVPLAYWCPEGLLRAASELPSVEACGILPRVGIQTSANFRFLRLQWEVSHNHLDSGTWIPFAKGGEYSPFADAVHLCVLWSGNAREQKAFCETHADKTGSQRGNDARREFAFYFREGVTYSERTTSDISPRLLVRGCITGDVGPGIYCVGDIPPLAALAVMSTATFKQFLEINVGLGDAVHSGSAARHYTVGTVAQVPFPRLSAADSGRLAELATRCVRSRRQLLSANPTNAGTWSPPLLSVRNGSLDKATRDLNRVWAGQVRDILTATVEIEEIVQRAYGLDEETRLYVESVAGRHPLKQPQGNVPANIISDLWRLSEEELVDRCKEIAGASRAVTKNAWWADRRLELMSTALGLNAETLLHAVEDGQLQSVDLQEEAGTVFEFLLGRAMGDQNEAFEQDLADPFDQRWARAGRVSVGAKGGILVDDVGHPDDIESAVLAEFGHVWPSHGAAQALEQLQSLACGQKHQLREWLRRSLFDLHLGHFSRSRRKAPIYWQLATPSASYSVWLYILAFSKDTLFRLQNDYVGPKLAHEERRRESLMSELREKPTAVQRKELAAQESIVEELRAFLEEVKRVAPLWSPNLDDGVIINFAPLWRLVPHHKPWQKELKYTWDLLCEGEYDWAHLAMHLWPERVVPKCAKDRSLAIAHGLEEVFWAGATGGQWTTRNVPARQVDELVRERTSPAVKSALKNLLEAPVATGKGGYRRGGRRRDAAPVEGEEV